VNLDAAQMNIDMLSMIQAKTKGNLDAEEDRLLAETLTTIQMNYVEVAGETAKRSEGEAGKEAAEGAGDATEASEPAADEDLSVRPQHDKATSGKDPKFHKSYGR
jgi:hypothetical protein